MGKLVISGAVDAIGTMVMPPVADAADNNWLASAYGEPKWIVEELEASGLKFSWFRVGEW